MNVSQEAMEKSALSEKFDVEKVRADFPVLATVVDGKQIAYLDSGATAQKPAQVIDRVTLFDAHEYATIHRGAYRLGEQATEKYEDARKTIARFLNAHTEKEIVITSGATESINLVAHSLGEAIIVAGDEIVITEMEHHANIVPWQMLCKQKGAILRVAPVDDNGNLILDQFKKLLNGRVKIVAVTHVSNVLGTINPVAEISRLAHEAGAVILVDGAQGAPHMPVDVQAIGCDFYVVSSHKMFGPTGVGVLYGRYELLNKMPPFMTGGDMIERVTFLQSTFIKPPGRFEAGTPPISQVIGMAAACDYLNRLDLERASAYEHELLLYGEKLLSEIPEVKILGAAKNKAAIISFVIENIHPHDIVTLLDQDGLALRGGHHCAQPLMDRFGVPATARASLAFYNTKEELDRLAAGIRKVIEMFA